jgi:hypothetical protein
MTLEGRDPAGEEPSVPRPPDRTLDELVDDAARRLDEASGGGAVCTFTKAGTPVPGIKYAEGRWAALREVQRARLRAPGSVTIDDLAVSALTSWLTALDRAIETDAGADWLAYRHGGVDALHDLADSPRPPRTRAVKGPQTP